jgi:hypothetical protein
MLAVLPIGVIVFLDTAIQSWCTSCATLSSWSAWARRPEEGERLLVSAQRMLESTMPSLA